MVLFKAFAFVSLVVLLPGTGALFGQAHQAMPARPGDSIEGVVHREGDERYRLAFGNTGAAVVEVSGAPADCALQVGSQGFQESDSSPSDWTDGQPGQLVRHSFRVQAGRPGRIWVMLRTRLSAVSAGKWSGVACSVAGPFYTTPDRGSSARGGPGSFEGRPVRPPITFHLVARVEGAPAPPAAAPPDSSGLSKGWPAAKPAPTPLSRRWPGRTGSLRDDRAGFALEYPEDWSAAPPDSGTYTLSGRAGTPAADAVVTVTVKPKSANSSPMQTLLRLHERLTDMGAELVKLGSSTLGGQNALFASHIYDDRNGRGQTVPFDHVIFVLDHGANYYLVGFVAPHDVFAQQTEAFKRISGSWRFLR
jgi:hypothetical protein